MFRDPVLCLDLTAKDLASLCVSLSLGKGREMLLVLLLGDKPLPGPVPDRGFHEPIGGAAVPQKVGIYAEPSKWQQVQCS